MKKKFVVGLTGNVGSGKTVVAELFAKKNIFVIDADVMARELSEQPDIKEKIIEFFSKDILLSDGSLNRKKLLQIILENPEKKEWLETLLHPLIFERMKKSIKEATSPYVIFVMPLLFEENYQTFFDRVCFVVARDDLKITRILKRDHVTSKIAHRLLNAQFPTEKGMNLADDVVTNNGTIEELIPQINRLHRLYIKRVSLPNLID